MIEKSQQASLQALLVVLLAVPAIHLAPAIDVHGQDVGFVFATNDDQKTQAFARRGMAIDIMGGITHIRLEAGDRTIDTFREVANPILVQTFDSLQSGTRLRVEVDRLLQISGAKLESIDFVLVDDAGGLEPDDTQGLTSIEEGGKHYIWPATNIAAWLDREIMSYQPDEPEDETVTIETLDDLDPEKRAEELNWEANFLEETADVLESLHDDAAGQLEGVSRSIASASKEAASKEAVLASLNLELDAVGTLHEVVAAQSKANAELRRAFQMAYEIGRAARVPVWIPDLPDYREELIQQMDELSRLLNETESAKADTEPIRRRLRTLGNRRAQLMNEMNRWKREAEGSRKRAEILRRRANGLLSGELRMADYRSGTETTEIKEGWSYEADVVLGSTLANRFSETMGDWSAWEGIILHRTLNSQFLSTELILGRLGQSESDAMPLFKAGWSEVALLGGEFDEADLSTNPHQALETGLGLFLSGRHSPEFRQRLNSFFDETGPKYVFPKNGSLTSGIPDAFADRYVGGFSDFKSLDGVVAHQMPYATGTVEVAKLRWEDVPAEYLLRSSATVTGFLLMVAAGWSDGSVVMDPLLGFCTDHWDDLVGRNLTNLVRRLSVALEANASEWTIDDQNIPAAAGLMPLAYLDLLTNFGLDRSDVYPPSVTAESKPMLLDEYWTLIRRGLRLGLDRNGLYLGGSNLGRITETTDRYLVCAVKFVGDQGSDSAEGLVQTCWPEGE